MKFRIVSCFLNVTGNRYQFRQQYKLLCQLERRKNIVAFLLIIIALLVTIYRVFPRIIEHHPWHGGFPLVYCIILIQSNPSCQVLTCYFYSLQSDSLSCCVCFVVYLWHFIDDGWGLVSTQKCYYLSHKPTWLDTVLGGMGLLLGNAFIDIS